MVIAAIEELDIGIRLTLETTTGKAHSRATALRHDAMTRIMLKVAEVIDLARIELGTDNAEPRYRRAEDFNVTGMNPGQNP